MFISTEKRKCKINVPQSAVSKRLTRVLQSQTVKHADLNTLQYDLSNEPVNGYSRLDSIGRQIEVWNAYCAAKENDDKENDDSSRLQSGSSEEHSSGSDSVPDSSDPK